MAIQKTTQITLVVASSCALLGPVLALALGVPAGVVLPAAGVCLMAVFVGSALSPAGRHRAALMLFSFRGAIITLSCAVIAAGTALLESKMRAPFWIVILTVCLGVGTPILYFLNRELHRKSGEAKPAGQN